MKLTKLTNRYRRKLTEAEYIHKYKTECERTTSFITKPKPKQKQSRNVKQHRPKNSHFTWNNNSIKRHKSEEIDCVQLEVRDRRTDYQMTKTLLDLESSEDRWAISD